METLIRLLLKGALFAEFYLSQFLDFLWYFIPFFQAIGLYKIPMGMVGNKGMVSSISRINYWHGR